MISVVKAVLWLMPCVVLANRIVEENSLPGRPSTEWDVNGAGDATIVGFSTEMSVNVGSKVFFKVKTDSTDWRADIYRMGYYNGSGARLVDTITPLDLHQSQPACDTDDATNLVDCANWGVSAEWQVPADMVSGLFFARLVRMDVKEEKVPNWRTDLSPKRGEPCHAIPGSIDEAPTPLKHGYGSSGFGKLKNKLKEPRASHAFFVVRDDLYHSDVVLQTADTTWQAYNGYGGLTTYGSFKFPFTHGPDPKPMSLTDPQPRAFKASYNRPLITRDYRPVNAPFNSEYPAIRFLESAGYDVTYVSGVDVARNRDILRKHKLYISVGHDEYVSYEQRKHIEEARDNGLNLAFLSGNEFYWAVRFEGDSANEDFRTMVCYKESQSNHKLDPLENSWTGTFRDSREINPKGAMPENALTGTIFTVNAQRIDSLVVPSRFKGLRVWRNTQVSKLKEGEEWVSFAGVLGHEWDEDLDNGFRPEGLIRLSETKVDNVQYIQDQGSVFDSASATHNLVMYKKNKSIVFGAGTVQWVWGLDNHHDINDPPRGNMYNTRVTAHQIGAESTLQQATINIFAEMGVQPETIERVTNKEKVILVRGDKSSDITAPTVLGLDYKVKDGDDDLQGSDDTLLNEADPRQVVVDVIAEDIGGTVAAVEVSLDGGKSWHPSNPLDEQGRRWRYVYGAEGYDAFYFGYNLNELDVKARAVDDSLNIGEAVSFGDVNACDAS